MMPSVTALARANDQAIRRALEQAGVEFIDPEKGGPGSPTASTTGGEIVFSVGFQEPRLPTGSRTALVEIFEPETGRGRH